VCVCACSDNWYTFSAYSNVLWIHYLIDKLLKMKRYLSASKSRQHVALRRQLRSAYHSLLDYNSAMQIISDCEFFA